MADNDYMLTTYKNPYNPFTEFDSWRAWDEQNGFFTCSLLDRFVVDSNELSEKEEELAIDHAVEDILNAFPGVWRKVTRNSFIGEGV